MCAGVNGTFIALSLFGQLLHHTIVWSAYISRSLLLRFNRLSFLLLLLQTLLFTSIIMALLLCGLSTRYRFIVGPSLQGGIC